MNDTTKYICKEYESCKFHLGCDHGVPHSIIHACAYGQGEIFCLLANKYYSCRVATKEERATIRLQIKLLSQDVQP
jgi:hypothetical protein